MKAFANNIIFDNTVLAAIIIGTILLAIEGPPGSLPAETLYLFDRINDVLFLIFLVEFGSKVIGYGFILTPESYLKVRLFFFFFFSRNDDDVFRFKTTIRCSQKSRFSNDI